MKQLFQTMLRAMDAGENLVLASVVRTAGSTPRGPGAHMLWSASGPLWGTVGGGPGEAQAMALCRQVLQAHAGLKMCIRDRPKAVAPPTRQRGWRF